MDDATFLNGVATNGHSHKMMSNMENLSRTSNLKKRSQTKQKYDANKESIAEKMYKSSNDVAVSTSLQKNFQEIIHDEDLCKEYVIRRGRTNLFLLVIFFIVFHVGAIEYYLELYTKDKRILFGLTAGILCFCGWTLNRKVIEESLLVISCLGVQITTKFASGRQTSIFFDRSEIKDIIIQESITMQCVVYILSILLKKPTMDDNQLLPLFKHSFPRLCFLQKVYQGVQSVMSFNSQPKR